ncbi:IS21-like element helper ATPase IstB [Ruminiclostridium josui]|uniref:IS21-like element helper ATPase IstB n=2 Tax=Ruminiclostridium josui TaxID=1499 RepID=UPI000466640E|nr:IS21-like element helper ATPase IstB [Ruminiclostridium josui]
MADNILSIIEGIASAMDTLFGSNLADAVSGWRGTLKTMTTELVGDAKIKIDRMDPSAAHLDRLEYGKAFSMGNEFGKNLESKLNFGNMFGGASDAVDQLKYSSETASNTGAMKDTMKSSEEDLKYLRDIAEQEAKSKKSRAVENQIKMSGFPYKKTLDMFDFDFQPSINREQIMELATMRFVENKENVVFLGTPGVGKTHLAVALGMIAAEHRYSTYYINCHNLITQLNKAHYENRLQERLKNFAKYKVLIIDEIGYLPMDIQGANLFFQLIAKRYERNTTIFTSNKAFSAWNEVFSDITITSAILDRILHHCQVVSIKGESYRLKERKEMMTGSTTMVNTLFKTKE